MPRHVNSPFCLVKSHVSLHPTPTARGSLGACQFAPAERRHVDAGAPKASGPGHSQRGADAVHPVAATTSSTSSPRGGHGCWGTLEKTIKYRSKIQENWKARYFCCWQKWDKIVKFGGSLIQNCDIWGQTKFRQTQTSCKWRLSSANMVVYCLFIAAISHFMYKRWVCTYFFWVNKIWVSNWSEVAMPPSAVSSRSVRNSLISSGATKLPDWDISWGKKSLPEGCWLMDRQREASGNQSSVCIYIYIRYLRHLSAVLFNPFSLSSSQSIITLSRHTMNGAVSGITPCANVPTCQQDDMIWSLKCRAEDFKIYGSQLAPSHHERSLAFWLHLRNDTSDWTNIALDDTNTAWSSCQDARQSIPRYQISHPSRKSHHAKCDPKCDKKNQLVFPQNPKSRARIPNSRDQPGVTFAWTSFFSGSFGAPKSWFTFSIQAPAELTKASHASNLSPSLLSGSTQWSRCNLGIVDEILNNSLILIKDWIIHWFKPISTKNKKELQPHSFFIL